MSAQSAKSLQAHSHRTSLIATLGTAQKTAAINNVALPVAVKLYHAQRGPPVNKHQAPQMSALPTLAALLASCALVAGCGGGGGGSSDSPTSGSQSVTPTTPTAPTTSGAASAPGEAASAPTASASSAQAAEPAASASASKSAQSSASGAASASAATGTGTGKAATSTGSANAQLGSPLASTSSNPATASQQAATPSDPGPTGNIAAAEATSALAASAAEGPTATALASASSNLARVKSAVTDMTLSHEIPPAGVASNIGWKYKPAVAMGTEPYGSAIGSWWTGTRYAQWRGILTWFVIYPGEGGSPAPNSAVEINGIELWYLSAKDKVWRRLQSGNLPSWNDAYAQNAISATTSSIYKSAAGASMSFAPGSNNMVHGGLSQVSTPWNSTTDQGDIDAIYAVARHRLVLKNSAGVDDRAKSKLVVQVGVDYYPWVGAKVTDLGVANYLPGAGVGRFLQSTNNWRYSTLLLRSKRITEAQMLAFPPPSLIY